MNNSLTPATDPENYFGIFGMDGQIKPCFASLSVTTRRAIKNTGQLDQVGPTLIVANDDDDNDEEEDNAMTSDIAPKSPQPDATVHTKAPKTMDDSNIARDPNQSSAVSPRTSCSLWLFCFVSCTVVVVFL
jgi:hypothetical protein